MRVLLPPVSEGLAMTGLGEHEAAAIDMLWTATEPLTVRLVLDTLNEHRSLAYTTVLDNRHRKVWVEGERQGRAFAHHPPGTREVATARALRAVVDAAPDADAVLLHSARSVSSTESAALRRALGKDGAR